MNTGIAASLFLAIGFGSLGVGQVQATPISVNAASLNIFRTVDASNDVHIAQGDNFQFGADVNGGAVGTSIRGIFTPIAGVNFITRYSPCGGEISDPDFCATVSPFSVAHTNGTWQVEFKNGANTATFALPPVAVIPAPAVPFPSSVTITAAGITPTISWTLPPGTNPNAFRINLYDKSLPQLPNGADSPIFSSNLPSMATSFAVPANAGLKVGGNYAIQLEVIITRDGGPIPAGSGNADILTRSSGYFDFSPPPPGAPPVIQLPSIGPNGVYNFKVGLVGPNSTTFIDPAVATGYIYHIGQGDPNFASVLLPEVGGGHFDLSYLLNGSGFTTMLDAGIQYFFQIGGVDEFTVTGINPAARLDPTNALSFVTGLTFVSDGSFSGTMTPITTEVAASEPGPLSLLGFGLAAMGLLRFQFRRRVPG